MTDVADRVLDCKGMSCPIPIIKTAKEIKTIDIGQVLELLATDPGVEPDMNAWTRRTKQELLRPRRRFHRLNWIAPRIRCN